MAKNKVLNTNGATIKKTVDQFEDYDVIRYSADSPDSLVRLAIKGGGKLDLSSELKETDAVITASNKALKLTTGDGDDYLIGGSGKDVFKGGDGDDTLFGGAGNDTLEGGAGNDVFALSGSRSGVDTFKGGAGTDTLRLDGDTALSRLTLDAKAGVERIDFDNDDLTGTSGADDFNISGVISYAYRDTIDLREGNDSFIGSQASDDVFGGAGADTLYGGLGNDFIAGGAGNDSLYGDAGDDYFVVSGSDNGVDVFRGGDGTDRLYLDTDAALSSLTLDAAASVEVIDFDNNNLTGTSGDDSFNISGVISYAYRDTIDLREGNDSFVGSQASDDVFGGAGNDTLRGGLGNDYISGGAGNDGLYGDAGDDYFVVGGSDNGVDAFRGGDGTDRLYLDTDTALSRLTLDAASSIEIIDFDNNNLTGTSGNDIFNISGVIEYTYRDTIDLREGNDTFTGSQANDYVFGAAGDDELSGGLGNDFITGGSGNDVLYGDGGNDYFVVSGSDNGVDVFRGGDGTDRLYLDTDTALSRLTLDAGSSVELIDFDNNDLTGTSGNDVFNLSGVTGYTYRDIINLREGNDSFLGSQAADIVAGSDGDDTLNGGLGNDTLYGGLGKDSLTGGSGSDWFNFDTGPTTTNVDTITDFTVGVDGIGLNNNVFTELGSSVSSSEFTIGAAATTDDQHIIYDSRTGNLFYDTDGVGGADQVLFAKISAGLLLSYTSFDAY